MSYKIFSYAKKLIPNIRRNRMPSANTSNSIGEISNATDSIFQQQINAYKNSLGLNSICEFKPIKLSPEQLKGLRLAPNTKTVSQYTLSNGKKVRVYEVSKEDKIFLDRICQNLETYMDSQGIAARDINDKRLIIETNLKIMQEKLQKLPQEVKTHMYIAESDSKLCGVLVGGLPKHTPKGEIIYSSRKGALPNETELNWFATWPEGNGIGKVLFSEYINTMKKDGFSKMFIQSEIPKLSVASKFYHRMGFDKLHKIFSERRVSKVEYNKDILDCLNLESSNNALYDYLVVPMLGTKNKLDNLVKSIFEKYKRETFIKSVDANNFIKEINYLN